MPRWGAAADRADTETRRQRDQSPRQRQPTAVVHEQQQHDVRHGHHRHGRNPERIAEGEPHEDERHDRRPQPQRSVIDRWRVANGSTSGSGPGSERVAHRDRHQGRKAEVREEVARVEMEVGLDDQVREVRHGQRTRREHRQQHRHEGERGDVEAVTPGQAHVQRREQEHRRVQVEDRGHGGRQAPQRQLQVPCGAEHRRDRLEEAEAVQQHGHGHGEEDERQRCHEGADRFERRVERGDTEEDGGRRAHNGRDEVRHATGPHEDADHGEAQQHDGQHGSPLCRVPRLLRSGQGQGGTSPRRQSLQ